MTIPNGTGSSTNASVRPKRILIIGGGPTGLVTLRNLNERGAFEEVQLVERRDDVGGVW
jgi:cation diffusion facilitator CzcD-associated flavoprotein CzcO